MTKNTKAKPGPKVPENLGHTVAKCVTLRSAYVDEINADMQAKGELSFSNKLNDIVSYWIVNAAHTKADGTYFEGSTPAAPVDSELQDASDYLAHLTQQHRAEDDIEYL